MLVIILHRKLYNFLTIMNKWIYFLVGFLLIIWVIGFFVYDFGVFIHILFVMALFIMLFEVIRDENK